MGVGDEEGDGGEERGRVVRGGRALARGVKRGWAGG